MNNREELKGKLLLLWIEDLIDNKEPGVYPEIQALGREEVEEVMNYARFFKATFDPSDGFPVDAGHIRILSDHVFKKSGKPQTNWA